MTDKSFEELEVDLDLDFALDRLLADLEHLEFELNYVE